MSSGARMYQGTSQGRPARQHTQASSSTATHYPTSPRNARTRSGVYTSASEARLPRTASPRTTSSYARTTAAPMTSRASASARSSPRATPAAASPRAATTRSTSSSSSSSQSTLAARLATRLEYATCDESRVRLDELAAASSRPARSSSGNWGSTGGFSYAAPAASPQHQYTPRHGQGTGTLPPAAAAESTGSGSDNSVIRTSTPAAAPLQVQPTSAEQGTWRPGLDVNRFVVKTVFPLVASRASMLNLAAHTQNRPLVWCHMKA